MSAAVDKPKSPTQEQIQEFVGKVITDERFRERLFEKPEETAAEMGLKLSAKQLEVLKTMSPEVLAMLKKQKAVYVLIPIADVAIVAAFA